MDCDCQVYDTSTGHRIDYCRLHAAAEALMDIAATVVDGRWSRPNSALDSVSIVLSKATYAEAERLTAKMAP